MEIFQWIFSCNSEFVLQNNAKKYADVIAKALNYVKTQLDSLDDIYALSVACYAAQLADHPSKTEFLNRLDKQAKIEGNILKI